METNKNHFEYVSEISKKSYGKSPIERFLLNLHSFRDPN